MIFDRNRVSNKFKQKKKRIGVIQTPDSCRVFSFIIIKISENSGLLHTKNIKYNNKFDHIALCFYLIELNGDKTNMHIYSFV